MAVAGARAVVTAQQKVTSAQSSCPSFTGSPLKRSFFSAKFLATPPNSIHSIYVADGVKLVDWPVEEMRDFLGTQRQWGQYILRDDKLCRQVCNLLACAPISAWTVVSELRSAARVWQWWRREL
jgi:hypothetical protein